MEYTPDWASWRYWMPPPPLASPRCEMCKCDIPKGTVSEHFNGVGHRLMMEADRILVESRRFVQGSRKRRALGADPAAETKEVGGAIYRLEKVSVIR